MSRPHTDPERAEPPSAAKTVADSAFALGRAVAAWPSPACLLRGSRHVYVAASEAYQRLVGGRPLLGLAFHEAFPELAGQGYAGLLDRAFAGEPQRRESARILWDRDGDGRLEEGVVDFGYHPVAEEGAPWGVLVTVDDLTERDLARREASARVEESVALAAELRTQLDQSRALSASLEAANRALRVLADDAEERARHAWLADAVSEAVTSGAPLDEVLTMCARALMDHLGAAAVRVWTRVPATGELVERASAGPALEAGAPSGSIAPGAGAAGAVATLRAPRISADFPGDAAPDEAAWAARHGVTALAAYPLEVDDALVGVVALYTRAPLSPPALEALRAVASRLSVAVARARAQEAAATERARAGRLQALADALSAALTPAEVAHAVLERGLGALGADAGLVAFLDEGGGELEVVEYRGYPEANVRPWQRVPLEADVPLVRAVRTARLEVVDSLEERDARYPSLAGIPSVYPMSLSVPLMVEGRAVGAMGMSFAEPRPIDPGDTAMLLTFGRLCAQAVRRSSLYAEAQAARAEAEAANRTKSEFLAAMSHEIRTPINAVVGYTDLLELGVAGPLTETQRGYLERVRASSRHLLGLVEDVLDLARVEAGRMEVVAERASAVEAATSALALVAPQAAARGVTVEIPCGEDDGGAFYMGDEDRVRQVLVNLLSNAVKFTPEGGRVAVTCGTVDEPGDGARLQGVGPWTYTRVEDTGIGIEPERVEAMFRPFVQAEAGHTRARGGTGLGLTISRQLARLMGGDLTARSTVGRGSTFTLWLPAESAQPPSLEASLLAETRGGAERPEGLAATAAALLDQLDAVLAGMVARLRGDAQVPLAAGLADTDLVDHSATLLADIAGCLVDMGRQEGDLAGLLRDGAAIQSVVADLHGAQRARMGWTEEALKREFAVVRELMAEAARRAAPRGADGEGAARLIGRFLEHAERVSQHRLARSRSVSLEG